MFKNTDVNGDGVLNLADLNLYVDCLLGRIPQLPTFSVPNPTVCSPNTYRYDFYLPGTTTVGASLLFPGFIRDVSPASYPYPAFPGFIPPSPLSLVPCDLTSNSSAELDCRPPHSPWRNLLLRI